MGIVHKNVGVGRITARSGSPHQRSTSSSLSGRSGPSSSTAPSAGFASHRLRSRFQHAHESLGVGDDGVEPAGSSAAAGTDGGPSTTRIHSWSAG